VTSARERLIVALDVATSVDAQEIVYELADSIAFYKVGLQLFTAEGPRIVSELVNSGRKVFLDLKLHDIPNTVAGAVKAACELGVHMFTMEAAKAEPVAPMILAVTVLTSFSQSDLEQSGVKTDISHQVRHLATLAKAAGCDGIVTSPHEAQSLRSVLGAEMAIVTPGIRPAGADAKDQSRISTPAAAIRAGASHLVVGRPIVGANNRLQTAKAIISEIEASLPGAEMETVGRKPA
jgi:orotidine-5'-phosphate decarboxylase